MYPRHFEENTVDVFRARTTPVIPSVPPPCAVYSTGLLLCVDAESFAQAARGQHDGMSPHGLYTLLFEVYPV